MFRFCPLFFRLFVHRRRCYHQYCAQAYNRHYVRTFRDQPLFYAKRNEVEDLGREPSTLHVLLWAYSKPHFQFL